MIGQCSKCGKLHDLSPFGRCDKPVPLAPRLVDSKATCTCDYPKVVRKNVSGHAEWCPVHIERMKNLK